MEFRRSQYEVLRKRLAGARRHIQVIIGPRQVGKTTLVRQFLQEWERPVVSVSADEMLMPSQSWLSQAWEGARRQADGGEALLVVDEVQKVEQWSSLVKLEWDRDTNAGAQVKVLLLGSSTLLIDRGLRESLAGRFRVLRMGHWAFGEMRDAFGWSVEQFVYYGGYPGAAELAEEAGEWLPYVRDSLVEPAIAKDVLLLTQIHKPALLRRAFELGCAYSGQLLSYTKMLGQIQDRGNTATLSHYLQVLDEAGLLAALDKYAGDEARRRASIPKFQVYNNALLTVCSYRRLSDLLSNRQEWGRWVESAVGAHIINQLGDTGVKMYYWREGNDEVDFVLSLGARVIALEVKSNNALPKRGMDAFVRRFSPAKVYLIGDSGIPLEVFLCMSIADLF